MQVTNNKVCCEEVKLAECGEAIAIIIAIETATATAAASQKVTKSSQAKPVRRI